MIKKYKVNTDTFEVVQIKQSNEEFIMKLLGYEKFADKTYEFGMLSQEDEFSTSPFLKNAKYVLKYQGDGWIGYNGEDDYIVKKKDGEILFFHKYVFESILRLIEPVKTNKLKLWKNGFSIYSK